MPDERPRDLGSDPKSFIVGRSQGMAAHSQLEDMSMLPKLIFRLVILPCWLPYKGWKIIKRRRQMAEFATARARNVIVNDRVVTEITLEWIEDHPADYAFGMYDPKVPKLQRAFKKILERHG